MHANFNREYTIPPLNIEQISTLVPSYILLTLVHEDACRTVGVV